MIEYFPLKNRNIKLVQLDNLIPEKNIFSILVGKNGTGKSTLLGVLTAEMVRETSKNSKYYEEGRELFDHRHYFPSEIIAVSTSPFDKFPIYRTSKLKHYTYMGLRDISSLSIGLGYLSKIIGSLIESIHTERNQAIEIGNVLEFLGYRDEINIVLDYSIHPRQFEEVLATENLFEEFDNRANNLFRKINRQFFTNADNSLNEKKLKSVLGKLRKVEGRANFVVAKLQKHDQTVGTTDRPSMGSNFGFF